MAEVRDAAGAERSFRGDISASRSLSHHGIRRFTTPTDSFVAARSNVAPEMFRVITRTVLFDHTAASSSMNRVGDTSDACARSPARALFTAMRSSPRPRSNATSPFAVPCSHAGAVGTCCPSPLLPGGRARERPAALSQA